MSPNQHGCITKSGRAKSLKRHSLFFIFGVLVVWLAVNVLDSLVRREQEIKFPSNRRRTTRRCQQTQRRQLAVFASGLGRRRPDCLCMRPLSPYYEELPGGGKVVASFLWCPCPSFLCVFAVSRFSFLHLGRLVISSVSSLSIVSSTARCAAVGWRGR